MNFISTDIRVTTDPIRPWAWRVTLGPDTVLDDNMDLYDALASAKIFRQRLEKAAGLR